MLFRSSFTLAVPTNLMVTEPTLYAGATGRMAWVDWGAWAPPCALLTETPAREHQANKIRMRAAPPRRLLVKVFKACDVPEESEF